MFEFIFQRDFILGILGIVTGIIGIIFKNYFYRDLLKGYNINPENADPKQIKSVKFINVFLTYFCLIGGIIFLLKSIIDYLT